MKLQGFIKEKIVDENAEKNVSVALYLATYYEGTNKSCVKYMQANLNDEKLLAFARVWENAKQAFMKDGTVRDYKTLEFEKFQKLCELAENGVGRKHIKLLSYKKIYSIPWILCNETLMECYPVKK